MTEEHKRTARKIGGYSVLAVFVAGANWGATQLTHREDNVDHRALVTQSQRLIDSVRFSSDLRENTRQLNEMLSQMREMNARLLELCLAVRAGCR